MQNTLIELVLIVFKAAFKKHATYFKNVLHCMFDKSEDKLAKTLQYENGQQNNKNLPNSTDRHSLRMVGVFL